MKKIIDSVKESWVHCILTMLIFSGVVFKNNPFFNVGVALVWCFVVLAVAMSTLNINFVKILNLSRGEAREGFINYAKRINNQTNFSKMLNKVLICIEFVSLAYCGWIATGIIFFITIFVMKMSVKFLSPSDDN
ncbi:hypothetical protein QE197_07475 [Arsenophonus nasoniae]|uniref:Uncharacterized protein n=1 Tax=Arsenophonus nasoniae TaxID=638 RepID=D2U4M1_9GAMM|nr:hypothetical protein [Arsenophonus nasoniae]QBY43230.1 hypothetical protein ArsFIN_17970 [Arsenophonus nasoniae]WGM07245.1 hypothetical protein QE258_08320 [Arsenophonus nasoniae]WGM12123.1 hypothetical protein QE197_07475 [Arsenophonus nasoniae]WGM16806.1 hypothetical protein QE193_07375 [Arsenophonus nasoniae]CBA76578.1 hypothetical protein ARN_36460 [Arsenophonus nasoniae]